MKAVLLFGLLVLLSQSSAVHSCDAELEEALGECEDTLQQLETECLTTPLNTVDQTFAGLDKLTSLEAALLGLGVEVAAVDHYINAELTLNAALMKASSTLNSVRNVLNYLNSFTPQLTAIRESYASYQSKVGDALEKLTELEVKCLEDLQCTNDLVNRLRTITMSMKTAITTCQSYNTHVATWPFVNKYPQYFDLYVTSVDDFSTLFRDFNNFIYGTGCYPKINDPFSGLPVRNTSCVENRPDLVPTPMAVDHTLNLLLGRTQFMGISAVTNYLADSYFKGLMNLASLEVNLAQTSLAQVEAFTTESKP